MAAKTHVALVVDPDLQFIQTIRDDPRAALSPPLIATSGREAQLLLAESSNLIAGVFINSKVITPEGGPDAVSVIRFSKQRRANTPIYVIYDEPLETPLSVFHELGVKDALKKPLSYSKMLQLVSPDIHFDATAVLSKAASNTDVLDAETVAEDSDFIAIRAADFVSGSKVFFDVYIRLDSGKYVKLIQTGDAFTPDRLNNYLKKGVQNFYLRKEQQEHYLAYCNGISKALLKSESVATTTKISQVFNSGEETLKFLKDKGLSEQRLQYVSSFVSSVKTLIDSTDLGKNSAFQKFMDDIANYEHGVSTSMVAALIADQLAIESESAVQIVGMSAMMHDIGLSQLPPELHDEDESKMSDEQKELYYGHPDRGAELLRQVRGVNASVLQAVRQHHERRNKKGFSLLSGQTKQINRVAEIVGISDDFVKLMARQKVDASFDPLQEMVANYFDGFTSVVVDAFRKVFISTKS